MRAVVVVCGAVMASIGAEGFVVTLPPAASRGVVSTLNSKHPANVLAP